MQFHSALAESRDLEQALDAVAIELRRVLGDAPLDLAVVFASATYGRDLDRLPVLLHERLTIRTFVGCTGQGQLDATAFREDLPAVSVLAGRAAGAEFAASAITNGDLPHGDAPPSAWRRLLPATATAPKGLLVLGEPFRCDVRALLAGLDYALPTPPKVGGIASGSRHPEGNALFLGRERLGTGAVVLAIAGDLEVGAVVAQGCRPIGRPGLITEADRNRLVRVDDLPVRSFVEQQFAALPEAELALAEASPLFLGIASDPFALAAPSRGEFLVRNVLGIDDRGHLVVGEHLTVGRAVQLHLRDRGAALDDLEAELRRGRADGAAAALMFRCIGRDGADHARFARFAPDVPLAGTTCNGEIGPVGGATHLHAYTASCLLVRPGSAPA